MPCWDRAVSLLSRRERRRMGRTGGRPFYTDEDREMADRIGQKIKGIRAKHEMTQEEFAREIDTTAHVVAMWESQSVVPSTKSLMKMSMRFGLSVDWFLFG